LGFTQGRVRVGWEGGLLQEAASQPRVCQCCCSSGGNSCQYSPVDTSDDHPSPIWSAPPPSPPPSLSVARSISRSLSRSRSRSRSLSLSLPPPPPPLPPPPPPTRLWSPVSSTESASPCTLSFSPSPTLTASPGALLAAGWVSMYMHAATLEVGARRVTCKASSVSEQKRSTIRAKETYHMSKRDL
jgi:hypothetical protein